MKSLCTLLALAAFSLRATAAELPPLITTYGEHTLAEGLLLSVRERGNDPIEFTIVRKFPDQTSTATSHSPLAAAGQPFLFCWVLEKKRLWIASPDVTGYVDLGSLPAEAPKESSCNWNLIHHNTPLSPRFLAEMPAHFRGAAAKWFRVVGASE